MPDAATTAYFFDGSSGCDLCDSHTGYYPVPVERPHPGCNCPVEEVEASEGHLDLRNLRMEESRDEIEVEQEFTNCDSDAAGQGALEIDEGEDDQLDGDLREFAEAHGWSPPESGDLVANIEIGPRTVATITLRVERYSVWMEAEMRTARPDGTEAQVGLMFGSYEKTVRIVSAEAHAEACPEPVPEHEVELGPGDVIV